MKKTILALGLLAGLLMAGKSQAILTDRGNGLIFDSTNNISWTKDADISGINNWGGQVAWAAGLTLGVFDDFRLASIEELASLYGQLPGSPGSNKTGDTSPFEDIQVDYWSGTELAPNPDFAWLFVFGNGVQFVDPKEFGGEDGLSWYGWAVRPGDSAAAVPEPATGLLMGVGLGVMWIARRRRGR